MINLRLPIFEGKSSLIFQFPHQHNSSMGPHEILEKFEQLLNKSKIKIKQYIFIYITLRLQHPKLLFELKN